jgi:hypothetical protein
MHLQVFVCFLDQSNQKRHRPMLPPRSIECPMLLPSIKRTTLPCLRPVAASSVVWLSISKLALRECDGTQNKSVHPSTTCLEATYSFVGFSVSPSDALNEDRSKPTPLAAQTFCRDVVAIVAQRSFNCRCDASRAIGAVAFHQDVVNVQIKADCLEQSFALLMFQCRWFLESFASSDICKPHTRIHDVASLPVPIRNAKFCESGIHDHTTVIFFVFQNADDGSIERRCCNRWFHTIDDYEKTSQSFFAKKKKKKKKKNETYFAND